MCLGRPWLYQGDVIFPHVQMKLAEFGTRTMMTRLIVFVWKMQMRGIGGDILISKATLGGIIQNLINGSSSKPSLLVY